MRSLTRWTALAALAFASACDDRSGTPIAPVEISPDALTAYVVVSNPEAAVGTDVKVSVRALRGRNVGPIGSYTIRLSYDPGALAYGKAESSPHGMVMANGAQAGVVVAAGASAEGFKSDELLATSFRVTASGGLKSLALTVTELNSLKFEDQRASLRVLKGIFRSKDK